MKTIMGFALTAAIALMALNTTGCQSKPPPDAGAAPQNGGGTGGSGTGTNGGDTGTHAP